MMKNCDGCIHNKGLGPVKEGDEPCWTCLHSEDLPGWESKRHGFDTKTSRYFHCSVCDYGVSDVYEDGPTYCYEKQKEWSYCPNCGVKMDHIERVAIYG